jgi:hypothetical protein
LFDVLIQKCNFFRANTAIYYSIFQKTFQHYIDFLIFNPIQYLIVFIGIICLSLLIYHKLKNHPYLCILAR